MYRTTYDVAIAGLGAMGSAAAYHLAKRGRRVLGLDRYSPPHDLGSSHGQTRIIREAYFEDPSYVPIVRRAHELWRELQETSGRDLLLQTGGLMIGRPEDDLVKGSDTSARLHGLPCERLSRSELVKRYPGFRPAEDMEAVWDPMAGILFPEVCIEAHLSLARSAGADLRFDEPVIDWHAEGDGVEVNTANARYRADKLIISAGAWLPKLIPDLCLPIEVERQVLFWFEPRSDLELFKAGACPIFVFDYDGEHHLYGFPDLGNGVKAALMHLGESSDTDTLRRDVDDRDEQAIRSQLERFLPDVAGRRLDAQVCMFTNTPDLHFLIDFHPRHSQAVIASPCSGHGFKFASAIGEILADLVEEGKTRHDISLFGVDRLLPA